jgi:cephalosporin hydroxylase
LALYGRLIFAEKPATIVEIGSWTGASALWFADQMINFGLAPRVVSIDTNPVLNLYAEGVAFLRGDARSLSSVLDAALPDLPRPMLVSEDSDHMASTCLSVLEYFHQHLRQGEYLVVEDGIVIDLGVAADYEGGPSVALDAFLRRHPNDYEIDGTYCDHYGYNVTYAINGYVKRLK